MNNEKKLRYESAQKSAEHYNVLIWTILGSGIALSLFILHSLVITSGENIPYKIPVLAFGYLALFVSTLAIESFSQKRLYFLEVQNSFVKENIEDLPYFKLTWLIELLILSPLFIFYISFFYEEIILFIISLFLFVVILINWLNRSNCKRKSSPSSIPCLNFRKNTTTRKQSEMKRIG